MKTVKIPRLLHELHGEESTVLELLLTYTVVIVVMGIVLLRPAARPTAVAWWEVLIVTLIAGDLAGGVVAGFTTGTDSYYASRPRLRIAFFLLHVVQPAILYFVIGGPPEVWIVIPAYAIVSGLVVNALPRRVQPVVAAGLVTVGIVVCFSWFVIAPPALWFGPVFLVKLVLAFAVRWAEVPPTR